MNPLLPTSFFLVTASLRIQFILDLAKRELSQIGLSKREWILRNGHSFRKGKTVWEGSGS
ncbi:hypothetical protein [Spirosoma aerolatum]|uniref:hypothetical protein n=1 Tax=Spirosoma aerolatum TaxID=1211326 RepID=UPI0012D32B67|nr:hypothetical protein [Spirosoma aerolatum]